MFIRLVRFEGGRFDDIAAESEEIRNDFDAVGRGEGSKYFPKDLTDRVSRMEALVDRQKGSVAILVYCDSAEDARAVDRIMDGMSPQREGWGKRVSRDIYEVLVDESLGARRAA
jgi:hypothetical protein